MSLTDTLQTIFSEIESLNIPEGSYLSISNKLKIIHDGIKDLEDVKTTYINEYNYRWEDPPQSVFDYINRDLSWGYSYNTVTIPNLNTLENNTTNDQSSDFSDDTLPPLVYEDNNQEVIY